MQNLELLKTRVSKLSKSPSFIHHKWFIKYHLEIVEKIAQELCDIYKDADRNIVQAMVWLHDYGKILDFNNQYKMTQSEGIKLLEGLNFDTDFIKKVMENIDIMDSKVTYDLNNASIEVKIVSSADAAAHFEGPFFFLWWYENSQKDFEVLMQDNLRKAKKDWERKIVLPEVKRAFSARFQYLQELCGILPNKYIEEDN